MRNVQKRVANSETHRKSTRRRSIKRMLLSSVLIIAVFAVVIKLHPLSFASQQKPQKPTQTASSTSSSPQVTTTEATPPGPCAGNEIAKLVLVSVSKRHMWACDKTEQLYDSAVVTGMEKIPADLTPVGTYHIYAKETNLYLNGSDTTGSWHDYVYYWMPFLNNQYGTYGFHDATWRPDNAFGNISPDSNNASHGCVELPLATAKWLYNWAEIGTTITIES